MFEIEFFFKIQREGFIKKLIKFRDLKKYGIFYILMLQSKI